MTKNHPGPASVKDSSLQVLRELLALHEHGTMTAAADHLGVPLATLSRHLDDFQNGPLGQTLLVQEHKSWRLTRRGESALPAIRDLVRQYDQLLRFLANDDDAAQMVRIGLGNFAAQHYFPGALIAARNRAAKLGLQWRIESSVMRGRERILGVHDGTLDLAIVSHTPDQVSAILEENRRPHQSLIVELLARHPFCIIAQKDSTAAGTLVQHPAEAHLPIIALAHVELVGLDAQSGIRRRLEQQLRTVSREPVFVPGTGAGGWYAAKEFARAGLGAALVPLAMMTESDSRDFVLRHMAEEITIDEYLIHRTPDNGSCANLSRQELIAALFTTAAGFREQTIERWSAKQ
jgi:DNA-binding transcriptional LysR family regulator